MWTIWTLIRNCNFNILLFTQHLEFIDWLKQSHKIAGSIKCCLKVKRLWHKRYFVNYILSFKSNFDASITPPKKPELDNKDHIRNCVEHSQTFKTSHIKSSEPMLCYHTIWRFTKYSCDWHHVFNLYANGSLIKLIHKIVVPRNVVLSPNRSYCDCK